MNKTIFSSINRTGQFQCCGFVHAVLCMRSGARGQSHRKNFNQCQDKKREINMPEIIFESNENIIFEKTVYEHGWCKVDVKNKDFNESIMDFWFKNVLLP